MHTGAEIMTLFTQLATKASPWCWSPTSGKSPPAHRLVRFRDGIVEHDGAIVAEKAEAPA